MKKTDWNKIVSLFVHHLQYFLRDKSHLPSPHLFSRSPPCLRRCLTVFHHHHCLVFHSLPVPGCTFSWWIHWLLVILVSTREKGRHVSFKRYYTSNHEDDDAAASLLHGRIYMKGENEMGSESDIKLIHVRLRSSVSFDICIQEYTVSLYSIVS